MPNAKPAGGKPTPRVHLVPGRAAPLPMHLVRAPKPVREHPMAKIQRAPASAPAVQQHQTRTRPSSDADNRPPPMRAGSEDALALPSRIGEKLHYRDGRITTMDGRVLQPGRADVGRDYRPTRDGGERARPVYPQ